MYPIKCAHYGVQFQVQSDLLSGLLAPSLGTLALHTLGFSQFQGSSRCDIYIIVDLAWHTKQNPCEYIIQMFPLNVQGIKN